jgi:hypothetical protein
MQNDNLVPLGKTDQVEIKAVGRNGGSGVVRIGNHHDLRLVGHIFGNGVEINEKVVFGAERQEAKPCPASRAPETNEGKYGSGTSTRSPGSAMARKKCASPSWEPYCESTSVSGLRTTP